MLILAWVLAFVIYLFYFISFVLSSWNRFRCRHNFSGPVYSASQSPLFLSLLPWPLCGLDLEAHCYFSRRGAYTHTFLAQACSLRVCGTGKTRKKESKKKVSAPLTSISPNSFRWKRDFRRYVCQLWRCARTWLPGRCHMVWGKWLNKRVGRSEWEWKRVCSEAIAALTCRTRRAPVYNINWLLDMAAWQPVVNAAGLSHYRS